MRWGLGPLGLGPWSVFRSIQQCRCQGAARAPTDEPAGASRSAATPLLLTNVEARVMVWLFSAQSGETMQPTGMLRPPPGARAMAGRRPPLAFRHKPTPWGERM